MTDAFDERVEMRAKLEQAERERDDADAELDRLRAQLAAVREAITLYVMAVGEFAKHPGVPGTRETLHEAGVILGSALSAADGGSGGER